MTQPAKAQEPSMEEILASIRRIIADDEPAKPAEAAKPERPKAEAVPPERPRIDPSRREPERAEPRGAEPARPAQAHAEPPRSEPARAAAAPSPPPAAAPRHSNRADAMTAHPAASHDTPGETDILELTEAMAATEPEPEPQSEPDPEPKAAAAAARFQTIGSEPDVVFADSSAEPREEQPRRKQATPPPSSFDTGGLMSNATQSAVDSAFNTLAQTVLVQNARTLEDLVREMLRPMLKMWLDDNLPGLVERLVRAEIERVSRSRG